MITIPPPAAVAIECRLATRFRRSNTIMASAEVKRLVKQLPGRLAKLRGERSQRQFARDLGVFQQNVNRYESGTTPQPNFLVALALKEKVSLDWLLLGKGKPRRRG